MQKLMEKHRKFMRGDAGFSLVELIIVIAIMAALVAVLAPQYIKYVEKSKLGVDENAASEAVHAAEVAIADTDVYNYLSTLTAVTGATVDVPGVATVVFVDATANTATDALATAVKAVVGNTIDFKSNTYNGKTLTLRVNYNFATKSFSVESLGTASWSK